MALPAPTKLTRRYLVDFTWRTAVFLMILTLYLYNKTLLDVTRPGRLFWPLSLLWVAVLVLPVWEYRFAKYPQRFWFGSNCLLQCGSCKEQLCRYKVPRSPRFRSQNTTATHS